jgi:hypothetical protein
MRSDFSLRCQEKVKTAIERAQNGSRCQENYSGNLKLVPSVGQVICESWGKMWHEAKFLQREV